jgi:hypothetical protein
VFYFALGSGRVDTLGDTDTACVAIALALCLNILSDTDAACVATALFSPVFKKGKESLLG